MRQKNQETNSHHQRKSKIINFVVLCVSFLLLTYKSKTKIKWNKTKQIKTKQKTFVDGEFCCEIVILCDFHWALYYLIYLCKVHCLHFQIQLVLHQVVYWKWCVRNFDCDVILCEHELRRGGWVEEDYLVKFSIYF